MMVELLEQKKELELEQQLDLHLDLTLVQMIELM
jgi:hypothetical protein